MPTLTIQSRSNSTQPSTGVFLPWFIPILGRTSSSDAPKVQSLSEGTLALLSLDPKLAPSILQAYDELFENLADLIARKREEGLGEDMLSYLISLNESGKLTEQELVAEAA